MPRDCWRGYGNNCSSCWRGAAGLAAALALLICRAMGTPSIYRVGWAIAPKTTTRSTVVAGVVGRCVVQGAAPSGKTEY